MPTFKFNKLVRDKIVARQISSGSIPTYHHLSKGAFKTELINKIIEEAHELHKAKNEDAPGEIADVQQAINDLIDLLKIKSADVEAIRKIKLKESGGFSKGIYIDIIEISEKDKWVKHFRSNPDRYPEIK